MSGEQELPNVNAAAQRLYELLLSRAEGELDVAIERRVQEFISKSKRWSTHWNSLRFLDLERDAAAHDSLKLKDFHANRPELTSEHEERHDELTRFWNRMNEEGWSSAEQKVLAKTDLDLCVFCRRMTRWGLARVEAQRLRELCPDEVESGELLVRDWVVESYVLESLQKCIRGPLTVVINAEARKFTEVRNGTVQDLASRTSFRSKISRMGMELLRDADPQVSLMALSSPQAAAGREYIEFSSEIESLSARLEVAFELSPEEPRMILCKANYLLQSGAPSRRVQLKVELPPLINKSKEGEGDLSIEVDCRLSSSFGHSWRIHVLEGERVHEKFEFEMKST